MNEQNPPGNPDEGQPGFTAPDEEFPVDRLKARMNDSLSGRPMTVYLVLFAGAATLLLLLAVVWISATGGGDKEEPICTEIAPADARVAVLAGQVERINVLVDKDNPTESLTGIQLRLADDTCRQTPQGADIRDALYSVIGAVDLYNNYSDSTISVHYQGQTIQSELLATSTPVLTETPLPTETIAATESATPEATATEPMATETVTATVQPTETIIGAAADGSPSPETSPELPIGDAGA